MSESNINKPFKRGQEVFSKTQPGVSFFVAACYFDEMLNAYMFAAHGGGTFLCIYFERSNK